MKRWLPWVLLAVSAAFNAFLIAGMLAACAHHHKMRTPEGRAELVADELDMDDEQRAAYVKLVEESETGREKEHERRRAEYQRVWVELAKDEPDERITEEFLQAPGASERRKRFLERARGLMRILRPEQRVRVAEVMEQLHRRRLK